MRVDGGIAGGPSEVGMWIGIKIFLGKNKVNDVDLVGLGIYVNGEVVGLDVTMQKSFAVDVFNTGEHLICKHKNCLESEAALT